MKPRQGEFELVHYETAECIAALTLDPSNETVWATEQQMAELFGVSITSIAKHIAVIFGEGELSPNGNFSKMELARTEGGRLVRRSVDHYNLDVILSVGYRVSSQKATAFRRWATQTLRDYIVQGFAINEARLKDDPRALRDLAAKIRTLRSDEKNIYGAVRDVFAFSSTDYMASSPEAKSFFARLQDKFTFAVTGQTSAQILLERADHTVSNMGLNTIKGSLPSTLDVKTAKNYLDGDEIYSLHILCEQFLLFVESQAIRGQKLTMKELSSKFDDLIKVQGHPVFLGYKDFIAEKARNHALTELSRYKNRLSSGENP